MPTPPPSTKTSLTQLALSVWSGPTVTAPQGQVRLTLPPSG